MQEKLVQDAISNHKRLQKVLKETFQCDWLIEPEDRLNQEFNFKIQDLKSGQYSGARIDVIATFNNRKYLTIIETKSTAAPPDIEQLQWYVENCDKLKDLPWLKFEQMDFSKTIGILLAHQFAPGDYSGIPENLHLLQLDLKTPTQPFQKPILPVFDATDPPIPNVFKCSGLYSIKEHYHSYLKESLHSTFDRLRKLCLKQNDVRQKWIVENPKSGHLAIHYKGIYVACFFVCQRKFKFGFGAKQ